MNRRMSLVAIAVLGALAAIGWLVSTSGATSTNAAPLPDEASEHARVVQYWTPERVARAAPREIVVGGPRQQPLAKGGSSGGGTTTACPPSATATVGGSTWTCGGLVARTTGKVLFSLGATNYVCSGSVVTEAASTASIVLTAGHCAYDDVKDEFATNFMFIPAYQEGGSFSGCNNTAYGCWTATGLFTTTTFRDGSLNDDWAFARMAPGGKSGQSLQLDSVVGSQAIAFDAVPGTQVFAFGYPAAQKYKGRNLVYCAGVDFADTWGSTDVGLGCDQTGGSSGGPWLKDFNPTTGAGTLTSVNSFYYFALSNVMFGPTFDGYTAKTLNAALAGGASSTVAP